MFERLTISLPLLLFACASTPGARAQAGFVITGQVVDASGGPVNCARVCAIHVDVGPGQGYPCGWTNDSGEFRLIARRADRYGVIAEKTAGDRMSQFAPFYRHPTLPPPVVSLGEANPAQHVKVEIVPPSGVVAGRITDAPTGLPVEAAQINLCLADEPDVCLRLSAKRADGTFRVRAAHVPFTFEIVADGYETWRAPGGAGGLSPLNVPSGTTLGLDVKLKRRAGTLMESEKQRGVNLPAPAQLSPAADAVFDHYPRRTNLEWSPVAGAASYAVEIDYCTGSNAERLACAEPQSLFLQMKLLPPASGITGTSYEFNFVGAQPGRWRVWAVDAEGREGFKSPWRRFVYQR